MVHILVAYKQFPASSVGHAGGESLYALMRELRARGHQLSLVARIADDELDHLDEVCALCEHVYTVPHHRTQPGPRLLAFVRSYLALRGAIRRAIRETKPDFLHVETTQTAIAALGLRRPPASYRTQDVNWHLLEQRAARLSGLRRLIVQGMGRILRRLEPWICRQYDLMLAISEGDRRLLAPACGGHRILIVPLAPAVTSDSSGSPAVDGEANVLFVGAMSRDHNVDGVTWFLDRVWDRISETVPNARFYVVGGSPPDSLVARADGKRVVVTGYVDDLSSWYRAAAVFVSPLLVAGGLLQKVLDAMALGVPVVATPVSNHGASAVPDEHLLLADEPAAFADAVVRLLRDPALRARLGAAARQFVSRHYDLGPAMDRWETEVHALVGGGRAD
ncbi:MAG: glycosyltransferase [Anaerolineae bacterium]